MERRDLRRRQLLQLDQPISSIRARNRGIDPYLNNTVKVYCHLKTFLLNTAADEARKQEETKNVLQGLLGDYSESDEDNEEQVSISQLGRLSNS